MKTAKVIDWKGLKFIRFTQDTNCAISWQAGMDMPGCPDTPNTNLYAIGGEDLISSSKIKQQYPSPSSCSDITGALKNLNDGLAYATDKSKTGNLIERTYAAMAIKTYNAKISEYNAYYNEHCIGASANNTQSTTSVNNTGNHNGSSDQSSSVAASSSASVTSGNKKIPVWIYWAAGGVALVIIVAVALKSKKASE